MRVEGLVVALRAFKSICHSPVLGFGWATAVSGSGPSTTTVTVSAEVPHTRAGVSRCSTMCEPRALATVNSQDAAGAVALPHCPFGLSHVYVSQYVQSPSVHTLSQLVYYVKK